MRVILAFIDLAARLAAGSKKTGPSGIYTNCQIPVVDLFPDVASPTGPLTAVIAVVGLLKRLCLSLDWPPSVIIWIRRPRGTLKARADWFSSLAQRAPLTNSM